MSKTAKHGISHHRIQTDAYRHFSLIEANAYLPIVIKLTNQAALKLKPLQTLLRCRVPADPRNIQLQVDYQQIIKTWSGKMERLGLKVLGLWQIGFDCGEAWYVWQHPERHVRYYLEYAQSFEQRSLISKKHAYPDAPNLNL